jgi:DNA-binding transcriptional MerR regulator
MNYCTKQKKKDSDSMNNYTNEVSSLVSALKNKDREIQEIQENMSGWKKDTLAKLAEKFEVELNKELDRRMQEHKVETNNQQMQLDKIRKEMDSLIKEYRHSNVNNFILLIIFK